MGVTAISQSGSWDAFAKQPYVLSATQLETLSTGDTLSGDTPMQSSGIGLFGTRDKDKV